MKLPEGLGRYEVLFPIASGGMADVFAARVSGVGGFTRIVALKRVRTDQMNDEQAVTGILDEARIAAQIESPHVVSVIDMGRGPEGEPYLVMDLVVGVPLSAIMKGLSEEGGQLDPALAVEILIQLAAGLHDAHVTRGHDGEPLDIVHRDVSPQNALLGVDGVARITDFGIARFARRRSTTDRGVIRGKAGYITPEVIKGKRATALSDQFSLGVVGWELLMLERLFLAPNPILTMKRIASQKAPRLDEVRPEIPGPVADVIARSIDKLPKRRFEDVGAMARALRAAADECFTPVSRTSLGEMARRLGGEDLARMERGIRVAAGQAPTDIIHLTRGRETRTLTLPMPGERASRPSPPPGLPGPSPVRWVAAAVALGIVVSAGAWWLTRPPASPPPVAAPETPPQPSPPPAEPVPIPTVAEAPPRPPPTPAVSEADPEPEATTSSRRRRAQRPAAEPEGSDRPSIGVGNLLGSDEF